MPHDQHTIQPSEKTSAGEMEQDSSPLKRSPVFQWPSLNVLKQSPPGIFPLPNLELAPTLIHLSDIAAEDVTVDRIQRSHRVTLDWSKLLTSAFDFKQGTGFEYIRRPLEKEADVATDTNGYPTEPALEKLAKELGFDIPGKKDQFKLGYWNVKVKAGNSFESTDFISTSAYLEMWRNKVGRVETSLDSYCSVTVVDLFAGDIAVRYEQIKSDVDATSSLMGKADELLAKAVSDNGLDDTYRVSLRRALDMKAAYLEAKSRMRELQLKAESIGYRLEPQTGKLLKATEVRATFIPVHHRTRIEMVDELGLGEEMPRLTSERSSEYRPMPNWQETSYSHEEALNQSIGLKEGLFERQADQYISPTGHRLDDVLAQINPVAGTPFFETITIPVYDMGVNTGERLTRVITAFRPLIGRMPIRLPELFIEAKYRLVLRWNGVAAGEVVESTTLAPGEERTLVIERSTVIERETKNTATSSLDITSEARSELIAELEAESRRSRDASHSSNWSASASGGANFGIWNASGSASGGQMWNESTNEFEKSLSKLTQKAASSLTARTRYEVSSITSYKATTTTRESTTINLKNINQGAALTLFLHQLTNRYTKDLQLSELSVTVLPAAETLYASEFALPRQFPLSDVSGILKAMTVEALPIGYATTRQAALEEYYRTILAQLVATLRGYSLQSDASTGKTAEQLLDEVTKVINQQGIQKAIAKAQENFRLLSVKAINLLANDVFVDGPCAGLLMSTMPSPSTALEEYTNELRDAELKRRQAETTEILARARQLEAVANSFKPVPPELIALVRQGSDLKTVIVSFVGKLRSGRWLLLIDGIVQKTFKVTDITVYEYKLQFTTDQPWLAPSIANVGMLMHESSRISLPFVV